MSLSHFSMQTLATTKTIDNCVFGCFRQFENFVNAGNYRLNAGLVYVNSLHSFRSGSLSRDLIGSIAFLRNVFMVKADP